MSAQTDPKPDYAIGVNLASPRLGAEAVRASDEFFAAKERMLQDSDPVFAPDKYDDHGKWMDGWESRRRRDGGQDWCLVRLGAPGLISAVDIDTRHFTGNYPPAASLNACLSEGEPGPDADWVEILPPLSLGPSAHHFAPIDAAGPWNWLRLDLFPDGGVARLRVYGQPYLDRSKLDANAVMELSALKSGGRVVAYNNAHYGDVWALLSEGRGRDMGDGWETRRRREPGNDWIVIALGVAGVIEELEIDTAHFKGNFPDRASVQAARVAAATDQSLVTQAMFWKTLMPERKLAADTVHRFSVEDLTDLGPVTHLRLNIHPDGGVSRFRAFGKPAP